MDVQDVVFKGTKDGVIVRVNECSSFETIKEAITSKLSKSGDFFKSSKLYLDFRHSNLEKEHREQIEKIISENYGVSIEYIERDKVRMFNGIYEGRTKFIRSTIRSGQNIEFPGNIVIMGDVNPGGQVKAGGNVIVLGAIRGVVHAGSSENIKAIIAAFYLQPTQLRIANLISRPPDGEPVKPGCPEIARVKDGYIVIEPCARSRIFQIT